MGKALLAIFLNIGCSCDLASCSNTEVLRLCPTEHVGLVANSSCLLTWFWLLLFISSSYR